MIVAVFAAALAATSARSLPLQPSEVDCQPAGLREASTPVARIRKTTELPPARLEIAISRQVGACTLPLIIVRDVEAPRAAPLRREDGPAHRR